MDCIILMGIKHCGKSTQARLLSNKLNIASYDTDDVICEITGKGPREIYNEGGQEAFKEAETEACRHLAQRIADKSELAVIATGGGICCNEDALAVLRPLGKFVFLNIPEVTVADRIVREVTEGADGSLENLPAYIARKSPHSILEVRSIFHNFYVEREKLYSKIADIRIDMGRESRETNAAKIAALVSNQKFD